MRHDANHHLPGRAAGMYAGLLAALLALPAFSQPRAAGNPPLDASEAVARAADLHDTLVCVKGLVASVCEEEGCFIDIVPLSGKGHGVLVSGRHGSFKFPKDCVGKLAMVCGTFYSKVYPFSRMDHWHHHSWRAREKTIPKFAGIYRIEADTYELSEPEDKVSIDETPLIPYESPVVDLDRMEFEAARMGTGKKCLQPGKSTPEHSTGRYHELLFVQEGTVTVLLGDERKETPVPTGHACYVPAETQHSVTNSGKSRACYLFVYSLPEPATSPPAPPPAPGNEEHDH